MKHDQKLDLLKGVRVGLRVPDDWFRPIADTFEPDAPKGRDSIVTISYGGNSLCFRAIVPAPGQELVWERIAPRESFN